MPTYIYYDNGMMQEILDLKSTKELIDHISSTYKKRNMDWKKDVGIRMFQEVVTKENSSYTVKMYRINNAGKRVDVEANKTKQWGIDLTYKTINIQSDLYDKTDVTIYVLWESIKRILKIDLDQNLRDLNFTVKLKKGDLTLKGKFILFFSKTENCGRFWKYGELNEAMDRVGLKFTGARGIGGERPRECRYALGYDWRTNDQDKNVPDGSCMVGSPFPFGRRNERRQSAYNLEKKNWNNLKDELNKNPKRLRCFVCGLFEGEVNHIGQKTVFQKGHGLSHLSGGKVTQDNLVAICRYCNSEQKDIYDIDLKSGKKTYRVIPFLKNRSVREKREAFKYLVKHLKKEDVDKMKREGD